MLLKCFHQGLYLCRSSSSPPDLPCQPPPVSTVQFGASEGYLVFQDLIRTGYMPIRNATIRPANNIWGAGLTLERAQYLDKNPPKGSLYMFPMSTSEDCPLALETNGKISKEITVSTQVTDITEKIDQEKRCALCNTPIRNENGSKEHVIPNAIGGRKTVYNFICKDCNSATGAKWDHELVTQLKPPCTLLNIRRQRGENQPVLVETVGGDKIFIYADGRMSMHGTVFTERALGDQTEVNIRTSSMKELKKMLPGLVRKYPNLDIDQRIREGNPTKGISRRSTIYTTYFRRRDSRSLNC